MDGRKRCKAMVVYSPGHAHHVKSAGMELVGDEISAISDGDYLMVTITDTNNGVLRTTTTHYNNVTISSVCVIEEEVSLVN